MPVAVPAGGLALGADGIHVIVQFHRPGPRLRDGRRGGAELQGERPRLVRFQVHRKLTIGQRDGLAPSGVEGLALSLVEGLVLSLVEGFFRPIHLVPANPPGRLSRTSLAG